MEVESSVHKLAAEEDVDVVEDFFQREAVVFVFVASRQQVVRLFARVPSVARVDITLNV